MRNALLNPPNPQGGENAEYKKGVQKKQNNKTKNAHICASKPSGLAQMWHFCFVVFCFFFNLEGPKDQGNPGLCVPPKPPRNVELFWRSKTRLWCLVFSFKKKFLFVPALRVKKFFEKLFENEGFSGTRKGFAPAPHWLASPPNPQHKCRSKFAYVNPPRNKSQRFCSWWLVGNFQKIRRCNVAVKDFCNYFLAQIPAQNSS